MDEIDQLHAWLLSQQIESTIFGSGQAEVLQQLADLLATKGIPNLGTFERAQLVLNKLGLTQVGNIMRGKNVWAALKAAASRPGHLFRLVTADERAAYVAKRTKTKHGAQESNHRSKKSAKPAKSVGPIHIDPEPDKWSTVHSSWMSMSFLLNRCALMRLRQTREEWYCVPHQWPNISWTLPKPSVLRHWHSYLWTHTGT